MATLKYLTSIPDRQTVTLGADYTAGSGTMTLTTGHGVRLPADGDLWLATTTGTFRMFKMTARSTDTLTVTAAQDGTSDANLSTGQELAWDLGPTAFDQFRSDITRVMTVSAFDALASTEYKDGDHIILSDSLYEAFRSGGAWKYRFGGWSVGRPPSTGWSWDNQTTSTVDSTNGYEYLGAVKTAGTQVTLRYRTAPSTPYTVIFGVLHDIGGANNTPGLLNVGHAVFFRDSSGKLLNLLALIATNPYISADRWTNSTTYGTTQKRVGGGGSMWTVVGRSPWWYKLEDEGATGSSLLRLSWSIDRQHWEEFYNESRTAFFASGPTQYGFGSYVQDTDVKVALFDLTEG